MACEACPAICSFPGWRTSTTPVFTGYLKLGHWDLYIEVSACKKTSSPQHKRVARIFQSKHRPSGKCIFWGDGLVSRICDFHICLLVQEQEKQKTQSGWYAIGCRAQASERTFDMCRNLDTHTHFYNIQWYTVCIYVYYIYIHKCAANCKTRKVTLHIYSIDPYPQFLRKEVAERLRSSPFAHLRNSTDGEKSVRLDNPR